MTKPMNQGTFPVKTEISMVIHIVDAHSDLSHRSEHMPNLWLVRRPKIGLQDQLSLNAGQKYCRMLPLEHSAILSTFIKLPFVIKTFVLSIFEWPFYTGFTVAQICFDDK